MARIAVILSGCGVFDGSEIHEATATLLALDRAGADVTIAAPTGAQMHVIDHQAGEPADDQTRDIRIESARIARGPVADVADLSAEDFDAVILPGGFGAAKNLCDFAVAGADCTVNPVIAGFVTDMHGKGKVVGAMCIAPALVAKVLGGRVKLTIGSDPDTAAALEAAGAAHVDAGAADIVVDEANRVVSTPAYMLAGSISEVFDGIEKLVKKVIELC